MCTEPDTLFVSLSVKEVETYERSVRSAALEKQQELRRLVGQSYEDLLSTANTIIDMADSSDQLSSRLNELSQSVHGTATNDTISRSTKKSRRLSFLPAGTGSLKEQESQLDAQEARFALGASLKLIMDAPEYVWRSVEKGKTLQAAWTFMLARAAWFDLNDNASSSVPAALKSAASEASSKSKTHVKQTFPFIEKQWQSMIPMRKQILQRATSLLADAEIEHMAVADQLATLMLLDGVKADRAFRTFLSQRQMALRRILHRRPTWSETKPNGSTRRPSVSFDKRAHTTEHFQPASVTSASLDQFIKLYARTLQHAVQLFALPGSTRAKPLLHEMLADMTDSGSSSLNSDVTISPSIAPAAVDSAKLSPALARAAKRKSSYGMPTVAEDTSTSSAAPLASEQPRQARVSSKSVLQALPSAQILMRLLPPSIWAFSPYIELDEWTPTKQTEVVDEACKWSASTRELAQSSPDSVQTMLEGTSDIGKLAGIRSTCRASLVRVRRVLVAKMTKASGADSSNAQIVPKIAKEIDDLGQMLEDLFQQRLEVLLRLNCSKAVESLLEATRNALTAVSTASFPSQNVEARSVSKEELEVSPIRSLVGDIPTEHQIDNRSSLRGGLSASEASNVHSQQVSKQLLGRTPLLENLAKLYEGPVAALRSELSDYVSELGGYDQNAAKIVQESSTEAISTSRSRLVKRLQELLNEHMASVANAMQHQVPVSVELILRLIAVLTTDEQDANIGSAARDTIRSSLKQCWQPIVERRIERLLAAGCVQSIPDLISKQLLTALTLLSESIMQLGSCLVSEELAEVVTSVLSTLKAVRSKVSDPCAREDVVVLESLLAREESELHPALRCVSALLVPLLSLLKTERKDKPILVAAEPVSLSKNVPMILQLANGKAKRFQPLPTRL